MRPQNNPDRIRIVFDGHRLVANAGLLLPATLAKHLGLWKLVDHHPDLGSAPGRANTGNKMLTLVASTLEGGDCIGDADALRVRGTACAASGGGHVSQLDRVSRQLLARGWPQPSTRTARSPSLGPLPMTAQ